MPETILYFIMQFAVLLGFFGVLDFIIMLLIRRNVKWPLIITAGLIYFAVIFFGLSAMSTKVSGQGIMQYMTGEFNTNIDMIAAEMNKKGATEQDIQAFRKECDQYIIKILPAWFLIVSIYLIFLNYLVMRLFVYRKYGIQSELKSFELWYLNEGVIWLLIISLAVVAPKLILDKFLVPEWLYNAALNAAFVLFNLYFFTGAGIFSFMMKKFKFAPFLQIFIYFLGFIFFQYIALPVAVTGVFDTWFNFRKIEKGGNIWK